MTKAEQKKVITKVKKFLKSQFGDLNILGDFFITTGDEGERYSEYASKSNPFMSLDGSPLYEFINYGSDSWAFVNAFDAFLKENGLWYEQGNAWNLTIYED
jgi:hypothetical protein